MAPYLLSTRHPRLLGLSLESRPHANVMTESMPDLPNAPLRSDDHPIGGEMGPSLRAATAGL